MVGTRSQTRCRGERRGAAAVEFAIVLPVLITIVLGCVDIGRFAYTYIAVTNAARAGAGFASANAFTTVTLPVWQQKTRDAVVDELGTAFNPAQISIPSPVVTTDPGGQRRVRVSVSYPFATLVHWPWLPRSWDNLTLARAVEMRMIR